VLASSGISGSPANGSSRAELDISDDGRFVSFASIADNLVPGDLNGTYDIFVYDQFAGTVECASVDPSGFPANGLSAHGKLSGDGRYVCFYSWATDIGLGSATFSAKVYVYDRQLQTSEQVSLDPFWNDSNGNSRFPAISSDGRFVGFLSWASNLVAGDTNGVPDYFIRDRVLGVTDIVSVSSTGVQALPPPLPSEITHAPAVSSDGRYVAFASYSTNLVSGDTNGSIDVFVRDRQMGTTERISVDSDENQTLDLVGPYPVVLTISDNGRYVCFNSKDSGLIPNDANPYADVFVRDRWKGITEIVHIGSSGQQGNSLAGTGSISRDGRYATFVSMATNLSTIPVTMLGDVFLHDRMTGGPDVDLSNVLAGQAATLTITGATPGGVVVLGASLLGQGILPTAWGPLELNGVSAFFAFVMDGAGSASVPVWLDPALLGLPLWVQGIDLTMDFPTSVWGGTIQ